MDELLRGKNNLRQKIKWPNHKISKLSIEVSCGNHQSIVLNTVKQEY